jgi:hypothetical protein
MNHGVITTLHPDTQDLWSACFPNTISQTGESSQGKLSQTSYVLSYVIMAHGHVNLDCLHIMQCTKYMWEATCLSCVWSQPHHPLYGHQHSQTKKHLWQDILIHSLNYISFLQSSLSIVDKKKFSWVFLSIQYLTKVVEANLQHVLNCLYEEQTLDYRQGWQLFLDVFWQWHNGCIISLETQSTFSHRTPSFWATCLWSSVMLPVETSKIRKHHSNPFLAMTIGNLLQIQRKPSPLLSKIE